MRFTSRGHALGFAERTLKNLEFIEKAYAEGNDVHVVTQLAVSLLGLIVFPWEQLFVKHLKKISLNALVRKGWPQWEISLGTCRTLYDLVWHLRNAISHGHLDFSSESRVMDDVDLVVEDYEYLAKDPNWRARISVKELRNFCLRFINLLENTIG